MIRKILFLLFFPLLVFAHGGDDHGEGKKATLTLSSKYFSSEVSSDKYELLLKYEPIEPGKEGKLKSLHLFMDESPNKIAIRFYAGELSITNVTTQNGKVYHLLNLPYYLVSQTENYINWLIKEATKMKSKK